MVPQESQAEQQERVRLHGGAGQPSRRHVADTTTVKGSQFQTSRCWSSPAPALAAPRPATPSLITQVCRRPDVYLQRHRLLLHLGRSRPPPPPTPSTRRARVPPGPTPCLRTTPSTVWAICYGQKAIRDRLVEKTKALLAIDCTAAELKAAARRGWIPWRTAQLSHHETSPSWTSAADLDDRGLPTAPPRACGEAADEGHAP